ncbi:hypothetical protein R1sor_023097 [Riccia sorocarpa]|uniref:Uncharacterized protein n=1 Tax=Riccia sorocarpa TaxID=122646 RepID=A0ABD3GQN6_9MARC
MYYRLQDEVDDRLAKWESVCREHFSSIEKSASVVSSSVKVVVSGDSAAAPSFKALDDQEKRLDYELLSLRQQLIEEERNARKIGREIASSEKKLAAYSSLNLPKFEVTLEEAFKSASELEKKRNEITSLSEQQEAVARGPSDRDTSHRARSRELNEPLLLEITTFQAEVWQDQRLLQR